MNADTQDYLEYVTSPGDRWDLIAYAYYGDGMRIAPLLRANPDLVGDADGPTGLVFKGGITLRIPVLEQNVVAQNQLPPWKRV